MKTRRLQISWLWFLVLLILSIGAYGVYSKMSNDPQYESSLVMEQVHKKQQSPEYRDGSKCYDCVVQSSLRHLYEYSHGAPKVFGGLE